MSHGSKFCRVTQFHCIPVITKKKKLWSTEQRDICQKNHSWHFSYLRITAEEWNNQMSVLALFSHSDCQDLRVRMHRISCQCEGKHAAQPQKKSPPQEGHTLYYNVGPPLTLIVTHIRSGIGSISFCNVTWFIFYVALNSFFTKIRSLRSDRYAKPSPAHPKNSQWGLG